MREAGDYGQTLPVYHCRECDGTVKRTVKRTGSCDGKVRGACSGGERKGKLGA